MVKELFSCKYLIGRRGKEIEKLQFLGGHFHRPSLIENGIVGLIDDQIRIFHDLGVVVPLGLLGHLLVSSKVGLDPGHQLLGVEGLYDEIVRTQLQSQNLIKDLSLSGEHNNGYLRSGTNLTADLIAVHSRKH